MTCHRLGHITQHGFNFGCLCACVCVSAYVLVYLFVCISLRSFIYLGDMCARAQVRACTRMTIYIIYYAELKFWESLSYSELLSGGFGPGILSG